MNGNSSPNADEQEDGEANTLRAAIAYATGTLGEAGEGLQWLRSWEEGDPEAMAELDAFRVL